MDLVLSFLEKQLIILPEGPVKKQQKEDVDSKSITDKFLHNRRSYGDRDMSNIKCPACRKEHNCSNVRRSETGTTNKGKGA